MPPAGRLATQTYPSGMVLGYSYQNGRLSGLTLNTTPIVSNIQYQGLDTITGWTWGNGTQYNRQYDLDGRITQFTLGTATRALTYDAAGNVTGITDPEQSLSYTYDALNRLTGISGGAATIGYQYDANGNRTQYSEGQSITNYSYTAGSNRLSALTGATSRSYSYDANGNVLSDGLHSYSYDAKNRLSSIYGIGSHSYNTLGQRVSRQTAVIPRPGDADGNGAYSSNDAQAITQQILGQSTAAGNPDCTRDDAVTVQDLVCVNNAIQYGGPSATQTVDYAYDDNGQLLGSYRDDGLPRQETVYLLGQAVAQWKQGKVYYLQGDQLGTPQRMIDEVGAMVWKASYAAFGQAAINDDPDADGITTSNDLRFPGQLYDKETGLHYNYFRDYDPTTGRYLESDPIGLEGGLNTYSYVEGNPLSLTDPTGEFANWVGGALIGATLDIGVQLAVNGMRPECIKLESVALAAAAGALNPFTLGSAATKAIKADRQLQRANTLRKGSRVAKRTERRSEKNRTSAWSELLSWGGIEGGAEIIGNLVPDDMHIRPGNLFGGSGQCGCDAK